MRHYIGFWQMVTYELYSLQVAYHGIPIKAYEVFTTALKARYLEKGFALPELEDQNPAGAFVLCVYVELM